MKISATIITLNEERNIRRAIESIRCCDEILVVDSGSTDRTVEYATLLGARIVETSWKGYAQQKNYAADHAAFDWVLSIDADEALTEDLDAEILALKQHEPGVDAYSVPRLAQYCGRWIQHSGWYPDRKLRLYHRRRAQWEGTFVHESVRTQSKSLGELRGNLLHFTCSSLSEHLQTLDKYTTLAAQELVAERRSASAAKIFFHPPWTFLKTYFLKRGFLDGMEGLSIAWVSALYTYLKYAKARCLHGQ